MIRKKERKKGMALSQIIILILGTIAMVYALGDNMKEVSAVAEGGEGGGTAPQTNPSIGLTDILAGTSTTITIAKALGVQFPTLLGGTTPAAAGAAATGTAAATATSTAAPAAPALSGILGGIGQLLLNAGIAAATYAIIRWILPMIFTGVDPAFFNYLALWAAGGYLIGSTVITMLSWIPALSALGPWGALVGGILATIGIAIAFLTYHRVMQEAYIFKCYSWMPESGGVYCNQCGQNGLPCTKYQCQSLGQQCELLNEGTGSEVCAKVDRNYLIAPEIQPWIDALLEGYRYDPDNAISPPDRGVFVNNTATENGCTSYYEPISFGITLDQPSMCKYSLDERFVSYEAMPDLLFSNGLSKFNHSIALSIPDLTGEGAIPVSDSGEHEVFVRCKNPTGVANAENFVLKFCISEQPDITAPDIIYVSPLNGMPVQSGIPEIAVSIYTNEPATCKWSHTDADYASMTAMPFSGTTADRNMLYKSQGTLTGLTSGNNKFYIRCADQLGNTMRTSEEYVLVGTQPLVIDSVGPTGIIKGSSKTIKVTLRARTSSGANEGGAVCEYNRGCWSNTGSTGTYTLFQYPSGTTAFSAYQHSQDLWIPAGSYTCSIKCTDLGGNSDTKTTTYIVETDTTAPIVVRAYNDGNALKLVTNEKAECVYDILNCNYNFGDGTEMTDSEDGLSHTTSWNTKNNLYVKCKDNYDNQPNSGTCSIVVRATNII